MDNPYTPPRSSDRQPYGFLPGMALAFFGSGNLLLIVGIVARLQRIYLLESYGVEYKTISLSLGPEQLYFELGTFLPAILAPTVFSLWNYVIHKSLRQHFAVPDLLSDWWGVLGYYIPLANMIMPYLYLRETCNGYESLQNTRSPSSQCSLFPLFWALWLITGFVQMGEILFINALTPEQHWQMDLIVSILTALFYLSMLLVMGRLERLRSLAYRSLSSSNRP